MKEELELSLCNKYPELCRDYKGNPKNTCMSWGFDCGDGWYEVIDATLDKINKLSKNNSLDVKLAQVKSKFGRLTIYIDIESGPSGSKIQEVISQIYSAIDQGEKISMTISEISGKPATQYVINGYVFTVTEEEAKELEK